MAKIKARQAPPANSNIAVPRKAPVPPPRLDWIPHVVAPPRDAKPLEIPVVTAEEHVRKKLVVLPGVCVACNLCELACSLTHEGIINPYMARLKVTHVREEGVAEPTICRHCNPAPCEEACPTRALFRSQDPSGVVLLDPDKCDQCHNCVEACPFDAIRIGPQGEVLKCDMCGGHPACALVCQDRPEFHPPHWQGGKISALSFVEPQDAKRMRRLLRPKKIKE